MRIELTIPAVPVAQPRPRAVNFGKSARMHEVTHIGKGDEQRPHPIAAFKATVRLAAQEAYSGPPLTGPLRVDCVFILPRPVGMMWKRKAMPRVPHTKKPDLDNLAKAVWDALTGTVFADDATIWDGRNIKWRAAGDEQPHVEIVIETLDVPCGDKTLGSA